MHIYAGSKDTCGPLSVGRNKMVSERTEARAEDGRGSRWSTADSASARTRSVVMVRVQKRAIKSMLRSSQAVEVRKSSVGCHSEYVLHTRHRAVTHPR